MADRLPPRKPSSPASTALGAARDRYSTEVEGRPSRFTNQGKDYQAWAERAEVWAEIQAWPEYDR